MEPTTTPPKKGLGPLAWLGIGCGGIVVLAVIGMAIFFYVYGPKMKKFAEEAQKNPTRAAASVVVMAGGEMVAEDDVNKRYTVKQKANGQMITFYWDATKNAPESVPGDFSAIPASANPQKALEDSKKAP